MKILFSTNQQKLNVSTTKLKSENYTGSLHFDGNVRKGINGIKTKPNKNFKILNLLAATLLTIFSGCSKAATLSDLEKLLPNKTKALTRMLQPAKEGHVTIEQFNVYKFDIREKFSGIALEKAIWEKAENFYKLDTEKRLYKKIYAKDVDTEKSIVVMDFDGEFSTKEVYDQYQITEDYNEVEPKIKQIYIENKSDKETPEFSHAEIDLSGKLSKSSTEYLGQISR